MAEPITITVTINGTAYTRTVPPRRLLTDFLRDELNLTATHVGCEHGVCGACTVIMNGLPVRSCLTLAVQADGAQVLTLEGLGQEGNLHPLQEAFWKEHAMQCGYCTPGMILAAHDLLQENPSPSRDEIREALSGNICRCTGYLQIIQAVERAAAKLRGEDESGPAAPDTIAAQDTKAGAAL